MPGSVYGQQGVFSVRVAHANSTLNTFMGGKRKQWMTNTTPVQPSPRPARFLNPPPQPQTHQPRLPRQAPEQPPPDASQHADRPVEQDAARETHRPLQPPPITPANVLPSPAPSDEPSPSFSNPKDSPNPRDLSLVAASPPPQNTGDAHAAASIALSPGPPSRSIPSSGSTAAEACNAVPAPAAEQTPMGLGAQSSHAMPPPSVLQNGQVRIQSQVPNVLRSATGELRNPDLQLRPGSADEHPNKRRRTGHVEDHDFELHRQHRTDRNRAVGEAPSSTTDMYSAFASQLDQRVQLGGGSQALLHEVENPRFNLLKRACASRDAFYLYLHALFCRWSYDPRLLPPLPSYNLDAISRGFAIVETVLMQNTCLSNQNLAWCASFPSLDFTKPTSGGINVGVRQVADFLTALSQHWSSLHQAVLNRHYPLLVDELLGKLQCYSPIMHDLLFRSSRRRLGVPDSDLGQQMDNYFAQDQKEHCGEHGGFQPVIISGDPLEVEARNWLLIQKYREIVSVANAEKERQQQALQQRLQQQALQDRLQQQALHSRQQDLQQEQIMFHQRSMQAATQQQAQHFQQFQTQPQTHSAGQQQYPIPQQPLPSSRQPNSSPAETASNPNSQWAPNQMQNSPVAQARRVSMRLASPTAHQAAQYAARPQPSGPYSGAGSPPQSAFSPHLPQHVSLSNSPTTPTMPRALPAQAVPGLQNYTTNVSSSQVYLTDLRQQARQYAPPGQFPAQWPADMRSTAMVPSPQMSMMQNHRYLRQVNPSGSPPLGIPQQAWMTQPRMPMHQQMEQHNGPAAACNNVARQMPPNLVIPRPGHPVDRSEYPHSHQDRRALLMSLHQCRARSPDRTRRAGEADERFYQYVHSFVVAPFCLSQYLELDLEVSSQQFERLCKKDIAVSLGGSQAPPVREYGNGSLRFRARCCRLQSERQAAEPVWVTREMMWPDHIFIHFNNQKLVIRRGSHNGKDLPVEMTDFVVPGKNRLKVALSKPPTAPDKRDNLFYLAVEIIEVASHSDILKKIQTAGRIDRDETLKKIRSRVTAAPDEDGIAVIDSTGVMTRELSIDLTDPFSAKIFTIPARGATCTHLECFDLETWLTTRPSKQQVRCGHSATLCTCPRRLEPSEPDKWKCPICFADARPGSLRIDSFLEGVRRQLEEQNKLRTKCIMVTEDGAWRRVEEPDDDGDNSGSDGDGPAKERLAGALHKSKGPRKSAEAARRPVEIIELD